MRATSETEQMPERLKSAEPTSSRESPASIPYEPTPGRFDEAFVSAGRPHPHTRGLRPPGGVWCHVSGCDLVRDGNGIWRVLEDNVRVPSGISYVLENRIAMGRLMPELFAGYSVRPVADYPQLLLDALVAAAPA